MPEKKLFLLDAYALIYRAYYAFIKNPRINSKGINTSAIFGFTNTLHEIISQENPSHIAVVFDPPGPTFRHTMYPEYKAQRPPTPEDIKISVPYIKQIINAFNVSHIEVLNYEADDTIGTLAKMAEKSGFRVYMMTPDKDYYQLISENIFLYKPRRSGKNVEIIGPQELKNLFGINNPEQIIDILALWGDSSDNIPGAVGIGEKTATKLINEFDNIDNLYNNTHKLKGKQKENIISSRETVYKAKELVTIDINVPISFSEKDLLLSTPDYISLKAVFEELEFKTLITRIIPDNSQAENIPPSILEPVQGSLFDKSPDSNIYSPLVSITENINTVDHTYILCDTLEKISSLANKLLAIVVFCFDTETSGLNVFNSDLIGISFSFEEHSAYYIPICSNIDINNLINIIGPVFENPEIGKIGQNLKFDIQILLNYGITVRGSLYDTMIAHYLLEPNQRHNLTYLAETYLNYTPVPIEKLIGKKGVNQKSMREVDLKIISDYACEDADITLKLWHYLKPQLEKAELFDLYNKIEMPLLPVLANMEKCGVRFDVEALSEFSSELKVDLISLEEEIKKLAGTDFNISSPKQLGEILFDRMKIIDKPKKTKTKQYTTSEDVLDKIRSKHEIIPKILEFRSLKKLLSTYIDALPKLINKSTGKIHTSFNQSIASTGRLSSSKPNLQNIPIRTTKGRELRKAFVPTGTDNILFSADYSQVELRLMAHLSNDANFIGAFIKNEDIHTATAARINNVNITDVTREMRTQAKTANFGIIYGISSFGLSQRLNISRKEAKQIIDNYFINYPGVKDYMDNNIRLAREKGYVTTIMGRKRYLRDINSRNHFVRSNAERNAINAPVQGSAADIIKLAMINIFKLINHSGFKSKMILQVHDELIFDVYKPELESIKSIVKDCMENAVKLKVPLTVEMGTGNNWLEAH